MENALKMMYVSFGVFMFITALSILIYTSTVFNDFFNEASNMSLDSSIYVEYRR